MSRKPRTWAEVQAHPAVQEVEVWPNEECKYWIFLHSGWTASSDPGLVHQGHGGTVREAIDDVFPIEACHCEDCEYDRKQKGLSNND